MARCGRQSRWWAVAAAGLVAAPAWHAAGERGDGNAGFLKDAVNGPYRQGDVLLGQFELLRHIGRFPLQAKQAKRPVRGAPRSSGLRHIAPHALLEGGGGESRDFPRELEKRFEWRSELGAGSQAEAWHVRLVADVHGIPKGTDAVLKLLAVKDPNDEEQKTYLTPGNIQKLKRYLRNSGDSINVMQLTDSMREECRQAQALLEQARSGNLMQPFASRLMACFGTNMKTLDEPYYELVEFCGHSNLHDYVAQKGALPPEEVMLYAKQLLEGLFLLSKVDPPRMHHDIKPLNIMLKTRSQKIYVHLIDYGFMREAAPEEEARNSGTPGFIPPEASLFRGDYRSATAFDAYSLGCTILMITTRTAPDILVEKFYPMIHDLITGAKTGDGAFTAEFLAEFRATFKADDFTHSVTFYNAMEDIKEGTLFPIEPSKPNTTSFTNQWWLKLMAAANDDQGTATYPQLRDLWAKHGPLLQDLFHLIPESRPTPEQLLANEAFQQIVAPADEESLKLHNLVVAS